MRLPFISRRRHETAVDFLAAIQRANLNNALDQAYSERMARLKAEAELASAKSAPVPVVVEHTELWNLIDWSLWGSGMGDVFREQLADQFIAAITPEQHDQALRLMHAWEDAGHWPTGRRGYEDHQRRLRRALRAVAAERAQSAAYRRTIRQLTDQLLDATGYQGEPLLPAAQALLGINVKEADA